MRQRPVSFAAKLSKTLSLSYIVGFCVFTDSKAFYQHVYALKLVEEES